ncbi:hypothetical protein M378DRAFT_758127 [Amanita muscaria Koide BX008]|uniref:VWFA domain-containing protein n=1 Tax=Amanita muscaria (strain Koide BX008) TaxID=946122 RepID=A0A0C2T7M4_AMAMK|nr:hypothetical protein M378DRAFT_758127 [Amanita muscaria Koide BX008]
MSFVTPSSCTDYKIRIDNADIQMPFGADKDDTRKAFSQSWTRTETRGGSRDVIKITNEHTEYTAQMQGNWKMGSGSGRVDINKEHAIKNTAFQMHEDGMEGSGSGQIDEITSELTTEDTPAEITSELTTEDTPAEITGELTTEDTLAEITSESATEEMDDQEMFEYWVTHSGLGDEIASKLGTEKEDIKIETAKEAATSLKPPPPPSDAVKGYNPWLDKSRPTTIEEYLRFFEVVFIVDDSSSMEGARWSETRDALATIFEKTFELNVHTVSLRFLNDARYVRGLKGKNDLTSLFDTMRPRGFTPLGRALKAVFDGHLDRIDSAVREGEESYSKIPPLDIIVLTDGMPTDQGADEPAKVIARAVERLNDSHYHPNTMGVQIIQIANEKKAKMVLRDLVVGDNGRIVDTVPYAGIVNSEKLLRILLGGVHPNIRSQLPVAMLAT